MQQEVSKISHLPMCIFDSDRAVSTVMPASQAHAALENTSIFNVTLCQGELLTQNSCCHHYKRGSNGVNVARRTFFVVNLEPAKG